MFPSFWQFSWTLIALTHYFPDEPRWDSDGGVRVSWEDLVAEEMRRGLEDAACGGTHRMAGIIRAIRAAESAGNASGETWQEAKALVQNLLKHVQRTCTHVTVLHLAIVASS